MKKLILCLNRPNALEFFDEFQRHQKEWFLNGEKYEFKIVDNCKECFKEFGAYNDIVIITTLEKDISETIKKSTHAKSKTIVLFEIENLYDMVRTFFNFGRVLAKLEHLFPNVYTFNNLG